MILEVEARRNQNLHHLVEVTTNSRIRITSRISILSHKVTNSVTNHKNCTATAHRYMTAVSMDTMNFRLRSQTIGQRRSTTTALFTATTRNTKTPNTLLDILSKTEELHTTGKSLQETMETIDLLGGRKRQHQGSTIKTLSTRNPVS